MEKNIKKMQASCNSKSSSSDDDLLLETEALQRKKHFLDYDYDQQAESSEKINAAAHTTKATEHTINNVTSSSKAIALTANQLDCKRKIIDRPSTSKSSTMADQLNNTKSASNNVETVYSILSMLGSYNSSSDITSKFLELSKSREMCVTLRQSGCISLLVQIIHSHPNDSEIRQKQCLQTLHNIIHCNADDKAGRREARVMKIIEQLFDYCDALRSIMKNELSDNVDRHPIQAIGTLMKISFDEEHRHAMCQFGAVETISTLIQLDHAVHGPVSTDNYCVTMRRYAGMCLTNLTFGDGNNKSLLCSNKNFMKALVDQINSNSDELVQVTASVIRNLSWRADVNMKQALNEIETVKILTTAAMKCTQENTLKAILSALWNLSNHCAKNKAEICDIDGAIEFLIDMLSYEAPSKTMAVIENAGGILRNISSHMAVYEEYRVVLRRKNCFNILLQQLKSPSLTVVSNACGTLGNLSANSQEDQKFLRDNGAIPMLRSLIYSKHKMISTGSTIALRHLLACKTNVTHSENLDSVAKMMDLKELPSLNVRKQRALEQELNLNRTEDVSPSSKDDKTKDFEVSMKSSSSSSKNGDVKVKDIEDEEEEAPTNFGALDNDDDHDDDKHVNKGTRRGVYQETNLDQITDYSIRYGDQGEVDDDVSKRANILSADDTMKCYNTEGTPATISKAGSMSDLRKEKLLKDTAKSQEAAVKGKSKFSNNASGLQSPEKTVNYCVEGTPGNFSRNDSLSDLEEAHTPPEVKSQDKVPGPSKSTISSTKIPPPLSIRREPASEKESIAATPKSVTFVNLADETPLMFSRTSSMGSLSSAEPACEHDDKSSVVSDFSRLASGIMSPSELPDSPTQSIPQSPSRVHAKSAQRNVPIIRTPAITREIIGAEAAEDCTNMFHVENTPAVFSSRTSLSNLSFDDEPKISTDAVSKDFHLMKHPSEDEEKSKRNANEAFGQDITAEHSDAESADDNILLESCISMGIHSRVVKQKEVMKKNDNGAENNGMSFLFLNYSIKFMFLFL
jgi:adenomatosis polyposis coli protein